MGSMEHVNILYYWLHKINTKDNSQLPFIYNLNHSTTTIDQ